MRLVITGANSFIGKHFLILLKKIEFDKRNEIICITRNPFKIDGIKFVNINACLNDYEKLFLKIKSDVLLHLAWYGTRGNSRNCFLEQNKAYNESLLGINSCIINGCKKIILAGSQAEYGIHKEKITEETVCNPNTWYGIKKLQLYNDIKQLCKNRNINVIEARFFSLYGIGDYSKTMVMSSIKRMAANLECNYTLSEQLWDYLNIKDAVRALYKLLSFEKKIEGVYNFASGDCRPLKEFIYEIKETLKSKSSLNFGAIDYPDNAVTSIYPDISKIKKLSWNADISFKDGIREIFDKMYE